MEIHRASVFFSYIVADDSIEENHADTTMALLEENKTLSLVDYRCTFFFSFFFLRGFDDEMECAPFFSPL